MKARRSLLPLSVFLVQLLLCAIAFKDFRMDPQTVAFNDLGDGMKNYYSLLAYVKEPVGPMGFFHYNGFQYPYGDAIWYTDATPLFAIVFKWICLHIHDWSDYTLPVYNGFILLNIPICGLLLYALVRRWTGHRGWAWAAAVALPWINPMILRIPRGHFNLSLSSLVVGALLLLVLWQEAAGRPRRRPALGAGMVALILFGATLHSYYLPILGIFLGAGLFGLGLLTRHLSSGRKSLFASVLVPLSATGLMVLLVWATDPWLSLRTQRGMGYDWMETKTRFTSLFSGYEFMGVKYPIRGMLYYDEPERAAYLGTAVLLLMTAFAVGSIWSRSFRSRFRTVQRRFFAHPLRAATVGAGVLLLAMSFGEKYETGGPEGLHLTNVFNPFLYLHPFVHAVEHFRCAGRFVWPFWFVAALWTAWTALHLWRDVPVAGRRLLAAGVLLFAGLDAKSHIDWMQGAASGEAAMAPALRPRALAGAHLDGSKYQAILPLPFYTVGTETRLLTLDDDNAWSRANFQMAVELKLPLMASKMGRTPPSQTADLLRFVAHDSLSVGMRRRMDDRPVLVALHRKLAADSSARPFPQEEPLLKDYYLSALSFAGRHRLQPVDSAGDVIFYAWRPPAFPR